VAWRGLRSNWQKIPHCRIVVCDYVAGVEWQQITALVIVAIAAAALLWGRFRRRRFSFQRDTHCGCSGASGAGPQGSILFRARKDGRSQVTVKMK
jgi:hypothetical protein